MGRYGIRDEHRTRRNTVHVKVMLVISCTDLLFSRMQLPRLAYRIIPQTEMVTAETDVREWNSKTKPNSADLEGARG
jgi:hypothetical protein